MTQSIWKTSAMIINRRPSSNIIPFMATLTTRLDTLFVVLVELFKEVLHNWNEPCVHIHANIYFVTFCFHHLLGCCTGKWTTRRHKLYLALKIQASCKKWWPINGHTNQIWIVRNQNYLMLYSKLDIIFFKYGICIYTTKNYAFVYDQSVKPKLDTSQLNVASINQLQSNSMTLIALGLPRIAASNYVQRLDALTKDCTCYWLPPLSSISYSKQVTSCHLRSLWQFGPLQMSRSLQ
jgi:hypothetical protein